jgi:hypothetical protein
VPASEQLLGAIAAGDDERTKTLIEEVIAKGGGVSRPALSDAIEGSWRLVWSAQARPPPHEHLVKRTGSAHWA